MKLLQKDPVSHACVFAGETIARVRALQLLLTGFPSTHPEAQHPAHCLPERRQCSWNPWLSQLLHPHPAPSSCTLILHSHPAPSSCTLILHSHPVPSGIPTGIKAEGCAHQAPASCSLQVLGHGSHLQEQTPSSPSGASTLFISYLPLMYHACTSESLLGLLEVYVLRFM